MYKFVKNVVIYGVIFFLLLGMLNYRYESTKALSYIDKFDNVPDNIVLFNTGSSHGLCDFCYDELEMNGNYFNFGINSQSLSYDYRLLQQYEDNFSEGAICFIPVSYFAVLQDEEVTENFAEKNARYYKFLEPQYIKQYNMTEDICVRYFPVLSSKEGLISILLKKKSDVNQFEIDWNRKTSEEEAYENAAGAVKRHVIDYKKDGTWEVNQDEIDALKDMIVFCKDREITPIMVTTPYLAEYNDQIPEEFKAYFLNVVRSVADEYDVKYYDYSEDARFSKQYDLFMNSDHLNRNGAIMFTEILLEEIEREK